MKVNSAILGRYIHNVVVQFTRSVGSVPVYISIIIYSTSNTEYTATTLWDAIKNDLFINYKDEYGVSGAMGGVIVASLKNENATNEILASGINLSGAFADYTVFKSDFLNATVKDNVIPL